VPFRRTAPVGLALAVLAAAACDDDPNAPARNFSLVGCPSEGVRLDVNAPIAFEFSHAVSPSSVSSANIVVTNAETGLTVPGSLNLSPDGTTITFDPDAPLPFDTELRVRVQNVLAAENNIPAPLEVCELQTQEPEITSTPWMGIGPATGTRLFGAALVGDDDGFVLSSNNPLLRRVGDEFQVVYSNPYFAQAYDVAFLDDNDQFGWLTYLDLRNFGFGSRLLQTTDGAETFEEIFGVAGQSLNRIFMRRQADPDSIFAVVGGGNIDQASFYKFLPASGTFAGAGTFGLTSNVQDVDFGPAGAAAGDTTIGVGVSFGVRFDDVDLNPGRIFVSSNGGAAWSEAAGTGGTETTVATYNTTFYMGAAVGPGGTLFVTGGSGTVKRLAPTGTPGQYAVTRILENRIANPDSLDPEALMFTDVEFAPDDRQVGWIVGAQRIGIANGVPQYRGIILETRDGGTTWTRQGVADAPDYGAEFPRLNRIEARSATQVWIVGDGGTVISYAP
jgi:hypothetical protein